MNKLFHISFLPASKNKLHTWRLTKVTYSSTKRSTDKQWMHVPEISIVLHNVPWSVELILETVLSITYISGLTYVTTIEVQSGTFNKHLPPWLILGQPSTIHSPHTEEWELDFTNLQMQTEFKNYIPMNLKTHIYCFCDKVKFTSESDCHPWHMNSGRKVKRP